MDQGNQRLAVKQAKIHSSWNNNCDKRGRRILSFFNKKIQEEAKAVLQKEKDLNTTIGKRTLTGIQFVWIQQKL